MPLHVMPFRGIRYTNHNQLTQLVAPPYDVIEPSLQSTLMARHPRNAVRLNLNPDTQPHIATQQAYHTWREEGTLTPDNDPALYAYTQQWNEEGNTITRRGFLTAILLDDDADAESARFDASQRTILPHERTIHKYIKDRIELYQRTLLNLSPIFLIYDDPTRQLEAPLFEEADAHTENWVSCTDDDGVIHRIQAVTDTAAIAHVQQHMTPQRLLIADGHHRFQTALTLKHAARQALKQQGQAEPSLGSLPTDYLFAFVTNLADDGLTVYPTHRLLNAWPEGMTSELFHEKLLSWFDVVDDTAFKSDPSTIQYQHSGETKVVTLRIKPEKLDQLDIAKPLRGLDVTLLDAVVMMGFYNSCAQDLKANGTLRFDRDEAVAHDQLNSGKSVAAFWVHAPNVRQVKTICESGELMPQKSTYFYPKLLTGLVFYPYHAIGAQNKSAIAGATPLTHFALDEALAAL